MMLDIKSTKKPIPENSDNFPALFFGFLVIHRKNRITSKTTAASKATNDSSMSITDKFSIIISSNHHVCFHCFVRIIFQSVVCNSSSLHVTFLYSL